MRFDNNNFSRPALRNSATLLTICYKKLPKWNGKRRIMHTRFFNVSYVRRLSHCRVYYCLRSIFSSSSGSPLIIQHQNGPTDHVALCLGLWTLRTLRHVRGRRRGQIHKRHVAGESAEQYRRLGNQPNSGQPSGRLPGYGFGQPRIRKRQVVSGVLITDGRVIRLQFILL